MVTLVKDPFVNGEAGHGDACSHGTPANIGPQRGYDGYVEPDTKIPPKARPVLAEVSVNGVAIDEKRIMAEAQQHPADNPGQALMAAARALVVRELLLQQARSLKVEAEPEVLEGGAVETPEDAQIRTLMEQEIETPVSDRTIRKRFYDLNRHRFKSETIYEARHILLAVRDRGEKDARCEQAKSLINVLASNPGQFGTIAREVSDCPSKMEGGNLGQLTTGSTVPEFERVLERMRVGQVWPEPVESRFGFHIILLVNKIPGELLPFEYVEEKIGAWLEASSWSRAVSQYISVLAGNARITGIDLEGASSPLVQ